MNLTGWSKSLEVTADGEGVVSHAGLALLRQLADKTGLTGGLSRALASPRLLIHDRGRVTADLACAIADGSEVISGFRVMGDQKELFGLVASVPTTWRTLDEIAAGGPQALTRITKASYVGWSRRVVLIVEGLCGRHAVVEDRSSPQRPPLCCRPRTCSSTSMC